MGAGLVVLLIPYGVSKCFSYLKSRKIYSWLKNNTEANSFKSTADIAKALQLPDEQVRQICARHKRIYEHTSQKDSWNIEKDS